MPSKAAYLFILPGFADWEPAHALAELRRSGDYRVEVVSLTGEPVESMGGLAVRPTRALAEVDPEDVAVFILPGGDRWVEEPAEDGLVALLRDLDRRGVPIAAICGATVAVARAGLLDGRRHTSNGRAWLAEQAPGYRDPTSYVDAPAVRDRGLITASGLGDVEFAREIMAELDVLSAEDREAWTTMFRSGRLPPESD